MVRFTISLLLGIYFGFVLLLSEAYSWFRIQEMFHFQSFHMFGLLFSAILTAMVSIVVLKRIKLKSVFGNSIRTERKPLNWKSNIVGGLIFGVGWAISGACSGPLFVLVGLEWKIGLTGLCGALLGALIYGTVSSKLKL